jgi:hypothetical protein
MASLSVYDHLEYVVRFRVLTLYSSISNRFLKPAGLYGTVHSMPGFYCDLRDGRWTMDETARPGRLGSYPIKGDPWP